MMHQVMCMMATGADLKRYNEEITMKIGEVKGNVAELGKVVHRLSASTSSTTGSRPSKSASGKQRQENEGRRHEQSMRTPQGTPRTSGSPGLSTSEDGLHTEAPRAANSAKKMHGRSRPACQRA